MKQNNWKYDSNTKTVYSPKAIICTVKDDRAGRAIQSLPDMLDMLLVLAIKEASGPSLDCAGMLAEIQSDLNEVL